jgi:lysylphosphatidylglycerol synthetase-like protein (DUF2156 family)
MALVTWPLLVAQMLIFGSATFTLAIAPPDPAERRSLQRSFAPFWLLLSAMVLVLSLSGLIVEASDMAGLPLGKTFPLLGAVMGQTHAGRLWAWRLACAVLLVIVAWLPRPRLISTLSVCAAAMMLLLLGSLSSHAIDHGAPALLSGSGGRFGYSKNQARSRRGQCRCGDSARFIGWAACRYREFGDYVHSRTFPGSRRAG